MCCDAQTKNNCNNSKHTIYLDTSCPIEKKCIIGTACECTGQFCFLVEFGILSRISSCIQGDPVHAGLYLQPWPRCTLRLCHFMLSDSFPWRQKPTLPIVTAKTKLSAGSQIAITSSHSGGRVKGYLLWTGFAAYGESTLCRMLTLKKTIQSKPKTNQQKGQKILWTWSAARGKVHFTGGWKICCSAAPTAAAAPFYSNMIDCADNIFGGIVVLGNQEKMLVHHVRHSWRYLAFWRCWKGVPKLLKSILSGPPSVLHQNWGINQSF